MLRRITAIAVLAAVLSPLVALAQNVDVPLPRPRPDPNAPAPAVDGDAPVPADPRLRPAPNVSALADPRAAATTPATEAIAALTAVPQPVHLAARITEDGTTIPQGLVWRVFETKADQSGELAMVVKSDAADPNLELPPGEYVVHVAYGNAQASDTLTVAPGDNNKTVILEAGGLRLNAFVTGDVPIPADMVTFDVFAGDSSAGDNELVMKDVSPNDIITVNAGSYHVISHFGDVNAVVKVDLRVEPGQLTDATLYHKACQMSFRLVSEPGGEAIADVEWTVKAADGSVVYSDINAFPSTVLEEGDYTVFAKRGDTVYNRPFEVTPGPAKDVEVLTTVYAGG